MAKVVFCEDSAVIQKLIGLALRSTAHEVHIASDGAEGLEIIERERPDVVFTDVSMPNLDGFQLADALKARPHPGAHPDRDHDGDRRPGAARRGVPARRGGPLRQTV